MRKVTKRDKNLVTGILISAFSPLKEENSINLIAKFDRRRNYRMKLLMEYLFEKALAFGDWFVSDNEKACLLLLYSDKEKATTRMTYLNLMFALKCIGYKQVSRVMERQRCIKRNYPKEPHIKPLIVAVKSENKNDGTAARLMLQVKNKFSNNALPVILDTASKQTADLYKKFGFRVVKVENSLGFPIYIMRMN